MKRPYLLLFLVSSIMIFYYGQINISVEPFNEIPDIINYRMMAEAAPGLSSEVSRNFGYRILSPWIVGILPMNVDLAFYLLTMIIALMIPLLLFKFFKLFGLKETTAFFITILFMLNKYTYGFAIWDFYDINDLLTHLLILLFFIALKKEKFFYISAILMIGVLNRETILFAVPAGLMYYWFKEKSPKKAYKLIVATLPTVIILTALRTFVITESSSGGGLAHSFGKLHFDDNNKIFKPGTYYRIAINTFLPLAFIPVVFLRAKIKFFKEHSYFIVFVVIYFLSCFIAGDNERLFAPVFPVFYLLIGYILEKKNLLTQRNKYILLGLTVLALPHHMYSRFPLPERTLSIIFSLASLTLITIYSIYMKFRSNKSEDRP
ncbi:MAG: hypothetical protein GQ534_04365 [Candidatus Delongbacteria bacterium]|nr:hypothetical protein [Candidatus Delongbacteria bacterium]